VQDVARIFSAPHPLDELQTTRTSEDESNPSHAAIRDGRSRPEKRFIKILIHFPSARIDGIRPGVA
jgi:hypothetical protein